MNREQMIAWLTLEGWGLTFWCGDSSRPRLSRGPIVQGVIILQWLGSYWCFSAAGTSDQYHILDWRYVTDEQLRDLMEKLK